MREAELDKDRPFARPGHFYSPLTDRAETRAYFASDHYRAQVARTDAMLDLAATEALWRQIAPRVLPFPFDPAPGWRYHGRNNQFEYFDASVLSGMIAHLNPGRVFEVGAGWSSAALFDTVERMEHPRLTQFLTIDPDLSRFAALAPPPWAEGRAMRVQDMPVAAFADLGPGDVLFIDSSHVLKTGSDVHYEYLHILPALAPGVIVHIHDIFYPFDYPRGWAVQEGRSWNEVYLVDMILTWSRAFEVLFFVDAFVQKCAARLRRPGDMFDRFDGFAARPMHRVNGSLWLRKLA